MLGETDALPAQGNALFDLADVFDAAGRRDEAAAALGDALERYERKQLVPLAHRTRERLATLEQQSRVSSAGGVSPPPIS
jgi:hypothetical protein